MSSPAAPGPRPADAPAPLWRRLAAIVYDSLPLVALWILAAAVWIALARWLAPGERALIESYGRWAVGHWPFRAWLLVTAFAYFGWSWRHGGQTIGMRAWRIRVVAADGGRPRWPALLLRFVVAIGSLAAAGLGYAWALVDRERRTWHDLASRTRTVLLPAPSKPA